ncbi:hypothetical protein PFLUV_G00195620 [Perca fluviatilis]|uniref:Uncharacterized protein n=1 Tax=Perca fluviatilis TaxID=8168 RepID=A0A6A5EDH2_PERFL|nr:hypothetical protein PFLUV_G00195620 [Perca fluviatilis]
MAAPPPRPLAISFDNPSLCFCNEKQHSSRGMTSSVSTGAGTEDATLPEDWIAPAGCCEPNALVVTPDSGARMCSEHALHSREENLMDASVHHSWHIRAQLHY